MATIPLADIKIGKRFRCELGDIDGLAASIADVGLLQPIVVTENDELVAGRRRIEAFKQLGRDKIPVHRVSIDAILRGEHAENVVRKDFTLTELDALGRALEARERELAKERQHAGQKSGGRSKKKLGANIAPSNRMDNQSSRRIAKALAFHGDKVRQPNDGVVARVQRRGRGG